MVHVIAAATTGDQTKMYRFMLTISVFAFACAATNDSDNVPPPQLSGADEGSDLEDEQGSDPEDEQGSDPEDDQSGDNADENAGPPVEATVRIIDAMSSGWMDGVTVENPTGDIETTDSNGSATVLVNSNSNFEINLSKAGAIDHLLFGPAGDEDFEYITFMATEMLVSGVLVMLGATPDEGTGVVVVGIDYDDLRLAVGAQASLDVDHDDPWVLLNSGPQYGDTIPAQGMGMVAFSNVQPGQTAIDVVPPSGTDCTAFPGGGEMPLTPVKANQVTVVTFRCR